ncbi:MAG: hypothetical protein WA055_01520 [Candidatus Moraniibacteriota bacterium]
MEEIKINIMNLVDFCTEANKSPLFSKRTIQVSSKFLEDAGFIKEEYFIPNDLLGLNNLIKEKNKPSKKTGIEMGLSEKESLAKREVLSILATDFGYIKKGLKHPKEISLITILRFIPKFNQWLSNLRKKYGIKPSAVRAEVYSNFRENAVYLVEVLENESDPYYDLILEIADKSTENQSGKTKQKLIDEIDIFLDNKYPKLKEEIYNFFVMELGFPSSYSSNLRKFILFNKIEWDDNFATSSRRSSRASIIQTENRCIQLSKEKLKNFEPHISIDIYGATDITDIRNLIKELSGAGVIKKFPSYKSKMGISRIDPKTILSEAIYFFLITGEKLTNKEANKVMENLKLKKVPANIASREITRFKKLMNL